MLDAAIERDGRNFALQEGWEEAVLVIEENDAGSEAGGRWR